jgi:hypothetical protein
MFFQDPKTQPVSFVRCVGSGFCLSKECQPGCEHTKKETYGICVLCKAKRLNMAMLYWGIFACPFPCYDLVLKGLLSS